MYIVLREKQGRAAGHICLEEGQGELCWRGRCQGKAVLLSGEGERWLTEQGRCPFVPVGALVLEGETLLAWGNAPGASLTEQELLALYKEKNVPEKTEEPPEKTEKPEDLQNEAGSQVSSQPSESCKPCMEERENTAETPRETPAPEDSGAEAAAFAALVAEAAQVYRQLESGETRTLQGPPEGRQWMAETESLLSPARKVSARQKIPFLMFSQRESSCGFTVLGYWNIWRAGGGRGTGNTESLPCQEHLLPTRPGIFLDSLDMCAAQEAVIGSRCFPYPTDPAARNETLPDMADEKAFIDCLPRRWH